MLCPKCNGEECNVVDSRMADAHKRRRRVCQTCDHRFTTMEYCTEETPADIEQRLKREILNRIEEAVYERR